MIGSSRAEIMRWSIQSIVTWHGVGKRKQVFFTVSEVCSVRGITCNFTHHRCHIIEFGFVMSWDVSGISSIFIQVTCAKRCTPRHVEQFGSDLVIMILTPASSHSRAVTSVFINSIEIGRIDARHSTLAKQWKKWKESRPHMHQIGPKNPNNSRASSNMIKWMFPPSILKKMEIICYIF